MPAPRNRERIMVHTERSVIMGHTLVRKKLIGTGIERIWILNWTSVTRNYTNYEIEMMLVRVEEAMLLDADSKTTQYGGKGDAEAVIMIPIGVGHWEQSMKKIETIRKLKRRDGSIVEKRMRPLAVKVVIFGDNQTSIMFPKTRGTVDRIKGSGARTSPCLLRYPLL